MNKTLARLLVIVLATMLGLGVYATDTATEPPVDSVVESVTEAPLETPVIDVSDESKFDGLLEGITNSTFWTTMGMILTAVIACIATFRKNFGNIAGMISNKADAHTINTAIKESTKALTNDFNAKLTEIEVRLNDSNSNEKILTTILTIFMTNANINPNAKAEIMQYLTGLKETNGTVIEIVDKANKIIEEANAAEVKEPTPALDTIVAEEETNEMVLG